MLRQRPVGWQAETAQEGGRAFSSAQLSLPFSSRCCTSSSVASAAAEIWMGSPSLSSRARVMVATLEQSPRNCRSAQAGGRRQGRARQVRQQGHRGSRGAHQPFVEHNDTAVLARFGRRLLLAAVSCTSPPHTHLDGAGRAEAVLDGPHGAHADKALHGRRLQADQRLADHGLVPVARRVCVWGGAVHVTGEDREAG